MMAIVDPRPPVQPGEPAPDFTLARGSGEGFVSLADFRGKNGVLLALMRGLQCPFCRRNLALLGKTREKLEAVGVETLAILATTPERSRLYVKHRLVSIPLAADPEMITHRAYGVPCYPMTSGLREQLRTVRVDPFEELPEPVPLIGPDGTECHDIFDRLDNFVPNETDQQDRTRQFRQAVQLCGQYLIDRDGVVRWTHIEAEKGGLAAAGRFPSDENLLAAARTLPT
jgi:peroxiredoxin